MKTFSSIMINIGSSFVSGMFLAFLIWPLLHFSGLSNLSLLQVASIIIIILWLVEINARMVKNVFLGKR